MANAYCSWAGRDCPPKPNGKKPRAAQMEELILGVNDIQIVIKPITMRQYVLATQQKLEIIQME